MRALLDRADTTLHSRVIAHDHREASLVSFWQSFRDKVPYKSYVVDLAIMPCDLDQDDPLPVRIVEFNPFVRIPLFLASLQR
jgi:hypothetical protein